jgi:hypothetical protein
MDRTERHLRLLIREELLRERALKVRDVKDALGYVKAKKLGKTGKDLGKIVAKQGVKQLIGLFTAGLSDRVVGAIETAGEVGEVAADAAGSLLPWLHKDPPEDKDKHPLWDRLTIDDEVSKILADPVEEKFLTYLSNTVGDLPDDADFPDIDSELSTWLKNMYGGNHVTKGE